MNGNYRARIHNRVIPRFSNLDKGAGLGHVWLCGGIWKFLDNLSDDALKAYGSPVEIEAFMLKAAIASCDFYIAHTPTDGVPYWDTGAPALHKLGDYLSRPADPFNEHEPVDSSAAAIGAQGLLRLGHYLQRKGQTKKGNEYWQAGLTVLKTLLEEPYLSTDKTHQGILLHSIYHQPNGWDNVPKGQKIACNESSMWGDYHARELALYVQRIIDKDPYYTFFNCLS